MRVEATTVSFAAAAVVLVAVVEFATVPTDGTVEVVSAASGVAEEDVAVVATGVAVATVLEAAVVVGVDVVVAAGVAAVVAAGDVVGDDTCWCVTVVSAYTCCTLVSATMVVYWSLVSCTRKMHSILNQSPLQQLQLVSRTRHMHRRLNRPNCNRYICMTILREVARSPSEPILC